MLRKIFLSIGAFVLLLALAVGINTARKARASWRSTHWPPSK